MRTKVKICGITNFDDAQYAAEEGAGALGFIFYDRSPRFIKPEQARRIIELISDSVLAVGVFVNCKRSIIEETVALTNIQTIQLSGDESPEDCLGFDRPVIKGVRIRSDDDLVRLRDYKITAVLLDGHKDGSYGGTGTRVDPALAKAAAAYFPIILAGGLTPDNIKESIMSICPFAIDLNSGLEKSPGKKDFQKISLLFCKLRELQIEY
jgi:phosphoribosylanthranilate isomerase